MSGGRAGGQGPTVSIEDARAIVLSHCPPIASCSLPVADALGHVLAAPVLAPCPLPGFTHSAMDGYALRASDSARAPVELAVVGEVMAGATPGVVCRPGEAVRIMTGAPLPHGADAVCVIEATRPGGPGTVAILEATPPGANVRHAGEDLAPGDEVFPAGVTLSPAHIGVLSSLGLSSVVVHPIPRVGVLSTGDELAAGPGPLRPGQIHDANGPALLAQLAADRFVPVGLGMEGDDLVRITAAIEAGARTCDAVIVSGGVSAGDRDLAAAAIDAVGLGTACRMALRARPGRPFAFGTVAATATPVFGLPGNPVAALVAYELVVRPGLRAMSGASRLDRPRLSGVADVDLVRRRDGKTHFVRVRALLGPDGRLHARPSGAQGSHVLRALADANALAVLPDGDGVRSGGALELLLLDAERLSPDPSACATDEVVSS